MTGDGRGQTTGYPSGILGHPRSTNTYNDARTARRGTGRATVRSEFGLGAARAAARPPRQTASRSRMISSVQGHSYQRARTRRGTGRRGQTNLTSNKVRAVTTVKLRIRRNERTLLRRRSRTMRQRKGYRMSGRLQRRHRAKLVRLTDTMSRIRQAHRSGRMRHR